MTGGSVGGYFGAEWRPVEKTCTSSHAPRIWWLSSANGDLHPQLISATDDPVQNGPRISSSSRLRRLACFVCRICP
jgi:hypothetical protein